MTTAQESTNGHRAFPPPLAVENPAESNRPDLPTNKADNNQPANVDPIIERQKDPCAANAYHVPPTRYAPKANSYRYDDFPSAEIDTTPLPERCQFMFSDGRQCTMARSDIHPSLCRFHAEREDQLFGSPVSGGKVVGAAFDLPELHSACRDLTTAAGVNRALAQVFRLFAQRRISRQEAATFGHLAQLLLRSIRAARAESMIQSEGPLDDPLTLEESLRDSARSRLPRRPSTEAVIPKTSRPISALAFADRAEIGPSGEDEESRAGSPTHAASACVGVQSAASVRNTPEISTSKNTQLDPIQNQHLHKMYTEGGSCSSGRNACLP